MFALLYAQSLANDPSYSYISPYHTGFFVPKIQVVLVSNWCNAMYIALFQFFFILYEKYLAKIYSQVVVSVVYLYCGVNLAYIVINNIIYKYKK